MKLSPNKYSYNKILTHTSRFPSLGIPRLDLEYPCWNTYVGHWNTYVGIPMSNVGIPTWVFSLLPRFLPNLMIFQCILYQ